MAQPIFTCATTRLQGGIWTSTLPLEIVGAAIDVGVTASGLSSVFCASGDAVVRTEAVADLGTLGNRSSSVTWIGRADAP